MGCMKQYTVNQVQAFPEKVFLLSLRQLHDYDPSRASIKSTSMFPMSWHSCTHPFLSHGLAFPALLLSSGNFGTLYC